MRRFGFSERGLARLHEVLARHVDAGRVPGLVAAVSRHGQTHVEAMGALEVGGAAMPPEVPAPGRSGSGYRVAAVPVAPMFPAAAGRYGDMSIPG